MTDLTDGSQEQRVGLTLIEMNFGHDALPGIADDNLCAAVGSLAPPKFRSRSDKPRHGTSRVYTIVHANARSAAPIRWHDRSLDHPLIQRTGACGRTVPQRDMTGWSKLLVNLTKRADAARGTRKLAIEWRCQRP
ncbi:MULTISPECIES: hypothetical protein [unclassified Bradyrhizobium]|uniref:hypothetical protein n=1 Tax=unclassified Bradyrhizobium TaxID=2631580 RepID=UPI0028E751B1|nr:MULTISPECIES: hypothetical protein [unclassified Bradyrhizobium]